MDTATAMLRLVLKSFGMNYPIRFGVGVCSGFAAKIAIGVALAYYPESAVVRALDSFPVYYYCLVIVGVFMVPVAFGNKGAPEEVSQQVNTIELLLDAANSSSAQRKLVWNGLIQKYLAAVQPSLRSPEKIDLVEEARKEIGEQATGSGEA